MKYRKFGSLEWKSSILGFGTRWLPFREDGLAAGTTASIGLIRYAIDRGVNYLDLGYPYDLRRQEWIAGVVGEALGDGYRHRIKISVTLPSHLVHSTSDFDRYLERQLRWLQADRASFCLFGRLNRETWPVLRGLQALSWAEAALKNNRVDAVGFSFHDHFQELRQVLAAYDRWAFCQFQFSYMDIDHDPGISAIKYAAEKGLAVIVTEPLRSGRLIRTPPEPVAKVWGDSREGCRRAQWGLRFVWNYPEVATAVHDVRSICDLAENLTTADSMEPDSPTVQEEVLVSKVRDAYRELRRIPCSSCRPCMPCPEGIDVPRIFELYNDAFIYEDVETARILYRNELHHAEWCNRCRDCEKRCTKKLEIVDWLERARQLLSGS